MDLAPAAQAALSAIGIDAHDGQPQTTPAGRYVALYGDSGLAVPHRVGSVPHWQTAGLRAVCVARTANGVRDLRDDVRQALTGRHLGADFTPLREQIAGPELLDGPEGDKRLSLTLTYTCRIPTRKD